MNVLLVHPLVRNKGRTPGEILGQTDLDPSKLGQDGYGWLYLAVWLFSVVVSFVNLLLSFTRRCSPTKPGLGAL